LDEGWFNDSRSFDGAGLAMSDNASIEYLRSTHAIRERANRVLDAVESGASKYWRIDRSALVACADVVAQVTRERYPSLEIPYHSRWRHFEAGSRDRYAQFVSALGDGDLAERARCEIDLAVTSVLLDAGAGPDWKYIERGAAQPFARSEGLGVASFHMFMSGAFSSNTSRPLLADADGLISLTLPALNAGFQVSASNPLIGANGRVQLLNRLGLCVVGESGFSNSNRVGGLFDHLTRGATVSEVRAEDILVALLNTTSSIWKSENYLETTPLGDCWHCDLIDGWMPFHKLSQWLTYSLLEPFQRAGVAVTELDALTGLPEYRNGGLFLDSNVIVPRNVALLAQSMTVGDQAIVEWRALTVALIDVLAPMVRELLGLTVAQMPLASVLEGGTWAAGRKLAAQKRGGLPPLNIMSDGTVF
jgi:hypothetical protein